MDGFAGVGATSGRAERLRMRQGLFTGPTSGLAPGNVQANLVILPKDLANDFLRFAQANPRPCPVLGVTEVGSPHLPMLGADLDLRTDCRAIASGGTANDRGTDRHQRSLARRSGWFPLGCSFSFEKALIEDGTGAPHHAGCNVPMFRTDLDCVRRACSTEAGGVDAADDAGGRDPSGTGLSRFPSVHGAPVHVGIPSRSASRTLRSPTLATPCRWALRNSRCSGRAASPRSR